MAKFKQFFLGGTAGILLALSFLGVAATVSYFGAGSADQLGVSLATLISGEDQTNNVLRTESQFTPCAKTADGACGAAGTRFVHTVTCSGNDVTAEAGLMQVRDATAAGAGTVYATFNFAVATYSPVTITLDTTFTTGLYLDFTTTTDVTCTASYR